MYACMHVCMYVCMCIYIYIYIYTHTHRPDRAAPTSNSATPRALLFRTSVEKGCCFLADMHVATCWPETDLKSTQQTNYETAITKIEVKRQDKPSTATIKKQPTTKTATSSSQEFFESGLTFPVAALPERPDLATHVFSNSILGWSTTGTPSNHNHDWRAGETNARTDAD